MSRDNGHIQEHPINENVDAPTTMEIVEQELTDFLEPAQVGQSQEESEAVQISDSSEQETIPVLQAIQKGKIFVSDTEAEVIISQIQEHNDIKKKIGELSIVLSDFQEHIAKLQAEINAKMQPIQADLKTNIALSKEKNTNLQAIYRHLAKKYEIDVEKEDWKYNIQERCFVQSPKNGV